MLEHMDTFSPSFKFVFAFAAIYAVLHTLYMLIPNSFLGDVIYRYGINQVAAYCINSAAPEEVVRAVSNRLISSKVQLEIVRGCDGSGVLFLIVAAMLAFGAPTKYKLAGMLAGATLVYLLNQARIIILYFVVAYRPDWFTPLHTYYIPTFLIVVVCIFFASWAMWATATATEPINEPHSPA